MAGTLGVGGQALPQAVGEIQTGSKLSVLTGRGGSLRELIRGNGPQSVGPGYGGMVTLSRSRGRAKWVGGQHQGGLATIQAVGKISGKNSEIQCPGEIDWSHAGSWFCRTWVLAKFSKQKTEGAQTGVFGENLDTNKGGTRAGWVTYKVGLLNLTQQPRPGWVSEAAAAMRMQMTQMLESKV